MGWSTECSKAFQEAYKQLTSACLLTQYNPSLPITLAADASTYEVGAVISLDGSECPIAFACRTLTSAEKTILRLKRKPGTNLWC